MKKTIIPFLVFVLVLTLFSFPLNGEDQNFKLNDKGYFSSQGADVIVFESGYPEGHQGGIEIIQHGTRLATNGNIYLKPTPGQWQPYPKIIDKKVDQKEGKIAISLQYPDSSRDRQGFNPLIYPDFKLNYDINVVPMGENIKISVDLDQPIPEEWAGKIGFNLELFPGELFGKTYYVDEQSGTFPRYANSPVKEEDNEYEAVPMAKGQKLTIAPDDKKQTMIIESKNSELELLDGRVKHNNGWFVVRSAVPTGKTENAIEWIIKPKRVSDWKYGPVVHTSQVGYYPDQQKDAVIELDSKYPTKNKNGIFGFLNKSKNKTAKIKKVNSEGGYTTVKEIQPQEFEKDFLRYKYLQVDFSDVNEPGMYVVEYDNVKSEAFQISENIFQEKVWQPVINYFLPMQMCHMKVFEKYRVWHDRCHLDDALMAPSNIEHFDGYSHGELPEGFSEYEHVDNLDRGGWHDAGDYDLRIESQLGTVLTLARAYEEFNIDHDQTLIDQSERHVEIHHPDGKPDVLQQIEHGLETILGGYDEFDKLYRGIITSTLRQYKLLGEGADMTDNKVFQGEVKSDHKGLWYKKYTNDYNKYFDPQGNYDMVEEHVPGLDDRFVFQGENTGHQLYGVAGLAAAARVLKGYNDSLANRSLQVAEALWSANKDKEGERLQNSKIGALVELILTTDKKKYKQELVTMAPVIEENISEVGWNVGRVVDEVQSEELTNIMQQGMQQIKDRVDKLSKENPFGIPYRPQVWGAGWSIQDYGFEHYYLYKHFPKIFDLQPMVDALNFVLGYHPGKNTSSFVSNVGTKSKTVAFGNNRVDWSFIPGGSVSGTNLIRPDFPEMKRWPYLWQQSEYVVGGGATKYMFLVLGAQKFLTE